MELPVVAVSQADQVAEVQTETQAVAQVAGKPAEDPRLEETYKGALIQRRSFDTRTGARSVKSARQIVISLP